MYILMRGYVGKSPDKRAPARIACRHLPQRANIPEMSIWGKTTRQLKLHTVQRVDGVDAEEHSVV